MVPENVFWDPGQLMNGIVSVITVSRGLAICFFQSETLRVEEGVCDPGKGTQLLPTCHTSTPTQAHTGKVTSASVSRTLLLPRKPHHTPGLYQGKCPSL